MHAQSPGRIKVPYGVAFAVHELVFIRAWAEKRGLTMAVLLDQTLDGAEFEEMLLVRRLVPSRQSLKLWRVSGGSVVAQLEGAQPRAYGGVHAALSHAAAAFTLRPAPSRVAWRRLLGLRPR